MRSPLPFPYLTILACFAAAAPTPLTRTEPLTVNPIECNVAGVKVVDSLAALDALHRGSVPNGLDGTSRQQIENALRSCIEANGRVANANGAVTNGGDMARAGGVSGTGLNDGVDGTAVSVPSTGAGRTAASSAGSVTSSGDSPSSNGASNGALTGSGFAYPTFKNDQNIKYSPYSAQTNSGSTYPAGLGSSSPAYPAYPAADASTAGYNYFSGTAGNGHNANTGDRSFGSSFGNGRQLLGFGSEREHGAGSATNGNGHTAGGDQKLSVSFQLSDGQPKISSGSSDCNGGIYVCVSSSGM